MQFHDNTLYFHEDHVYYQMSEIDTVAATLLQQYCTQQRYDTRKPWHSKGIFKIQKYSTI